MPINSNSVLKLALGLSIVIILNLLFNYGIDLFFKEPKYEDYCSKVMNQQYYDKASCEAVGGIWQDIPAEKMPSQVAPASPITGYCNASYKCDQELRQADSLYRKNSFLIMIALGFVSCILGFLVIKEWPIAFGFSYGGLIAFFIAAVKYWSNIDDKVRFFALTFVLIGLIAIGYKKSKDWQK